MAAFSCLIFKTKRFATTSPPRTRAEGAGLTQLVQSFEALQSWQEAFVQQANCTDPLSFPFIVVGNKIDVGEQKRAVPARKAQQWCHLHNCQYFEASAKDSTNVNTAFEELARVVVSKIQDGLFVAKNSIPRAITILTSRIHCEL